MLITMQPVMNYLFYILFVYCINLGLKKKFILNPYFLLIPTLFSLMVYNPRFSSFLISIPYHIYLIIFLGVISFLLGLIFSDKIKITTRSQEKTILKTRNKKLFWIALFLGLIPHIIGFIKGGFPIFNPNDIRELRENYLPAGLSYFTFFLPLTIIIAFILKNRKLIIISIFLNGFISVVRVSKFDILIFALFLFFSYVKYGKSNFTAKKKYLSAISIFFAVPFIFDWFYSLRNLNGSDKLNYLSSSTLISENLSLAISLPYLYFTSAWSNFTQTIQSIGEFNFGVYTFAPFISALQMEDLISYNSSKVIYKWPFNTHAFLTDYYMDFGIIGIIIIPFLVGFLVHYSYSKSIIANDPIKDGQFLVLGIPTLMLFFSNHFTSVGYPFIVYILYGILGLFPRLKIK